MGKSLADAMCSFVRRCNGLIKHVDGARHGPHPLAFSCVETILVAKVQRTAPGAGFRSSEGFSGRCSTDSPWFRSENVVL